MGLVPEADASARQQHRPECQLPGDPLAAGKETRPERRGNRPRQGEEAEDQRGTTRPWQLGRQSFEAGLRRASRLSTAPPWIPGF